MLDAPQFDSPVFGADGYLWKIINEELPPIVLSFASTFTAAPPLLSGMTIGFLMGLCSSLTQLVHS